MGFLAGYFNLLDRCGEVQMLCPFNHTTEDGTVYKENNPSAHLNITKGTFHCKACGRGYNDAGFIKLLSGCYEHDASRIAKVFEQAQMASEWDTEILSEGSHQKALSLGISEQLIKDLKIKTNPQIPDSLMFPVFMYGHLIDIRTYNPGGKPKMKSLQGAINGMIVPFELWKEEKESKYTLICAGEKDMAVARSRGFNAITLTGGERALPKFIKYFENRKIAIVYDNDQPGRDGAKKLAEFLYPYTKDLKLVTNFHEVCSEVGEDITDFFMKYNKTRDDLIRYIKDTPLFVPEYENEDQEVIPITDLHDASQNYVNKIVKSNIQVIATADTTFRTPSRIIGIKTKPSEGAENTMAQGDTIDWNLNAKTCGHILYLIDGALKEGQIRDNIRKILLQKPTERNLDIKIPEEKTVYKVAVTDLFETADRDVQPMEYVAYSINQKLESGKKYFITYKLVPHPYKGQQLTMIILKVEQASDSVNNFVLDDITKSHLKTIQTLKPTVKEKMEILVEMQKEFVGYDGINKLIEIIDLSFNAPLRFNFGRMKNIRGYLDTLIVGESRTGKSSTADALRKLYGLGTFVSLAGNSATIPGLVGGSSKSASGTMQTRAGVIPQNHGGLIIFEEFGKSNKDVLKELTDIRSSNEVRISRVSGSTTLPAMVRMIALTNTKTNGEIKPIASYPNGISIITELVPTAEDIARYDMILVLADTGLKDIDPLWEPLKALPEQVYRDRIRWSWTRTTDQVVYPPDMEKYIVERCNELNKIYPSHIKLFGTEAWKKISRIAQSVAAYVVSASEDFEKIIVTKECIDYAIDLLVSLYDNSVFKFKEYVETELRYRTTDEEAVAALQMIYNKYSGLVLQLEQQIEITKTMLESTTGLDQQDIRRGLQELTKAYFIKVDNTFIIPTERFRLTVNKINKNTLIRKVGEL
jgi:hypothetical protein